MPKPVAIVGVGQTRHVSRRQDVNLPELVREAVKLALVDAGLEEGQIDAVFIGNAPELFEGVSFPSRWLGTACAGYLKPVIRIHTGGTVGASTTVAGYYAVASGLFETVLVVSFEKLSDGVPMYPLSAVYEPLWGRDFAAGAAAFAALQCRMYMARYPEVTVEHFAKVAARHRRNGTLNEYAHLQHAPTPEEVLASPPIVSPLTLHMCCPTTDGAAAMVLTTEANAGRLKTKAAFINAVGTCSEGAYYPGQDIVAPASLRRATEEALRRAGIRDPVNELDLAELYVAFAPQELIWLEAMGFCPSGDAPRRIEEGFTDLDGVLPVCPSGGVMCSNPIGASGMLRQLECALQVTGRAGKHQIPGAKKALAHAWGGAVQFHVVTVISDAP